MKIVVWVVHWVGFVYPDFGIGWKTADENAAISTLNTRSTSDMITWLFLHQRLRSTNEYFLSFYFVNSSSMHWHYYYDINLLFIIIMYMCCNIWRMTACQGCYTQYLI